MPRIAAALEGLGPAAPDAEIEYGRMARMMIRAVGPKGPNNIPVPKMAEPQQVERGLDTIDRYLVQLKATRELVKRAAGLDCGKVLVASPISSLVKLSVPEALAVLASHGQRHIGQAEHAASG